jgi:hypothetical protein
MAKQKGSPKTGGRQKGSINRTTAEAKEMLEKILFGQVDGIAEALEQIRKKDPAKYLDVCSKFYTYIMPKKTDVTSDNKAINPLTIVNDTDSGNV